MYLDYGKKTILRDLFLHKATNKAGKESRGERFSPRIGTGSREERHRPAATPQKATTKG